MPLVTALERKSGNKSLKEFKIMSDNLFFRAIVGLQPRDKAAMLGVKTKEYFLKEFT